MRTDSIFSRRTGGAAAEGCRELCREHPDVQVNAVSAAGARQSFVLLDGNGRAFLGLPNIDNRGRPIMAQVPEHDEIYRLSGKWATEDFGAAKLLGLRMRTRSSRRRWRAS